MEKTKSNREGKFIDDQKRTARIGFTVSQNVSDALAQAANDLGISKTQLVIDCIKSNTDVKKILNKIK